MPDYRSHVMLVCIAIIGLAWGCTCGIKISEPPVDGERITSNDRISAEIMYGALCEPGDCEIRSFSALSNDRDITSSFSCSAEQCTAPASELGHGSQTISVFAHLESNTYMCRVGGERDRRRLYICSDEQWVNVFDFNRYSEITAVQATPDGGYIATGIKDPGSGSGDIDIFLMKLSNYGYIEWLKTYNSQIAQTSGITTDHVKAIENTPDGGFIMVGWSGPHFYAYPDFSAWVLKISNTGIVQWQKSFDSSYHQWANSVELTDDDNDGYNDDGYIIAGETAAHGPIEADPFVLKIDSSGGTQWLKGYRLDFENNQVSSIKQISKSREYIVSGMSNGKGWIIKLDVNGNVLMSKIYREESGHPVSFYAIEPTPDEGFVVAGSVDRNDGLILKLDEKGIIQWQKRYGGTNEDGFSSIRPVDGKGYIVYGHSKSTGTQLANPLLLMTDPDGNIQWQKFYAKDILARIYADADIKSADGGFNVPTKKSILKVAGQGEIQGYDIMGQTKLEADEIVIISTDLNSSVVDPDLVSQNRTFKTGNWELNVRTECCY